MTKTLLLSFSFVLVFQISEAFRFTPLTEKEEKEILEQYEHDLKNRVEDARAGDSRDKSERKYAKDEDYSRNKGSSTRYAPTNGKKGASPRISDSLYQKEGEGEKVVLRKFVKSDQPFSAYTYCDECNQKFDQNFKFCPLCARELNRIEPSRFSSFLTLEFVKVIPKDFIMGKECIVEDQNHCPPRKVRLSQPFEISKTEISQGQWQDIMGFYVSEWEGSDLPVQRVSWNQIQEFIHKVNHNQNQWVYSLPTEAQWEYVAQAGNGQDPYGSEKGKYSRPRKVDEGNPDELGLYNVLGNVWEWVSDWYAPWEGKTAIMDPKGPETGTTKVYKGGGYGCFICCTPWNRQSLNPEYKIEDIGFRLIRVPRVSK